MAEPWEYKVDDSRKEDSLTTFIIFCEDELCEPFYFREFEKRSNKIKINAVENSKSGKLNLNTTIRYCFDEGLMDTVDHSYKLKEGITENVWCVYDRDFETEFLGQVEQVKDIEFTNSIRAAEITGLRVAWSNDAFELWILLHFEAVPTGERLHRKYIYNRLTHIFKNVVPQNEGLLAITSKPLFNYKHNMKRRNNFLSYVLPLLQPLREQAILNASALEANFDGTIPYHNCNPCTKVHHLVKSIIAVS